MSAKNRSPSREDKSTQRRGRSPAKKDDGGIGELSNSRGSSKGSSKSPPRSRSASPSKDRARSKSPGKFGADEFNRKKVSADSLKKRQTAMAKVRGLKQDPSQWSRQELLEKLSVFSKFVVDQKTGVASLVVEGKRLLSEDVQVMLEIMRRTTEIQVVKLIGCGLTDEIFLQLLSNGLSGLRHLKELHVQSNLLGSPSVQGVVKVFSKLSRKLQILDMQLNSLTFKDGKTLFFAFSNGIEELCGISFANFKTDEAMLEVLDVSHKGLRAAELGIVCAMLPQLKRLHTVNVADNRMSAQGLVDLVESVSKVGHIHHLIVSDNPATNEGTDDSGVQALLHFAKNFTQLHTAECAGILVPGSKEDTLLTHSLMANRSVEGKKDGYYFNKFATSLIERKAKPSRVQALSNWQGKFNELDLDFIRMNKISTMQVDVRLAEQSTRGIDEILLTRINNFANKSFIDF